MPEKKLHISHTLTTECNLRCKHCFLRTPEFKNSDISKVKPLPNPVEVYQRIPIKVLRNATITLVGGEILIPRFHSLFLSLLPFEEHTFIYTNGTQHPLNGDSYTYVINGNKFLPSKLIEFRGKSVEFKLVYVNNDTPLFLYRFKQILEFDPKADVGFSADISGGIKLASYLSALERATEMAKKSGANIQVVEFEKHECHSDEFINFKILPNGDVTSCELRAPSGKNILRDSFEDCLKTIEEDSKTFLYCQGCRHFDDCGGCHRRSESGVGQFKHGISNSFGMKCYEFAAFLKDTEK